MSRVIPVVQEIFQANQNVANLVRSRLDNRNVFAINWMASPGAGKTSVIMATIRALPPNLRIGYIDGDIATSIDAERVAELSIPVVQINTGGNCHLDANMLHPALDQLPLDALDLLFVENVGNLVCPANFTLGTHLNVLIASVPEGDDKPYKYPAMYRGVDVLILNKVDLLPYIPFDVDYFMRGVRALNPNLVSFQLSALHATGIQPWADWLARRVHDHSA